MNLNFDYREFQRDAQERFAKVYAESLMDQETDQSQNDETYDKIQKILNCDEAKKCHPYLYQLDMENINETDREKIDKIYETCVNRGVITEDDDDEEYDEIDDNEFDDGTLCGGPADALTDQSMETPPTPSSVENNPHFTVLYSASKDGQIKVGEYYATTAMSSQDAKNQCIDQLSKSGYSAVRVLGVEQNQQGVEGVMDTDDSNVGLYDVYEDDSSEYEAQETGTDDTEDVPAENAEQVKDVDSSDTEETKMTDGEEQETEDTEVDDTDDVKSDDTENTTEKTDTEDTEGTDDSEKSEDAETEEVVQDEDGKKLTADEKQILKDEYNTTFKGVLKDMKLEKSVNDMTMEERVEFYKKMSEKWTKNDPAEFLKKEDQEKLNNSVVKNDK